MEGDSNMKTSFLIAICCVGMLFSTNIFAGCGDDGGCGDGDGYCGGTYDNSTCQCTDPACNRTYDLDCLSKSECCEAFGNVGGR